MILVPCGWRHTIFVSYSDDLYTFCWSKYGQLGYGDFKDHLVTHKLEALHLFQKKRKKEQLELLKHYISNLYRRCVCTLYVIFNNLSNIGCKFGF